VAIVSLKHFNSSDSFKSLYEVVTGDKDLIFVDGELDNFIIEFFYLLDIFIGTYLVIVNGS
jgi:hypothetical protein